MFISIRIDTSITKNNQNVSTESSNEFLLDPFRELINIISSCSAVGLPRFIAHKAKTTLALTLESHGTIYLIDIRTLLYIITLIGAITSISLSITTYQVSVYIQEFHKIPLHSIQWFYGNTTYFIKKSKIYQISGLTLTLFSILTPMFIYNLLNGQILLS